MPTMKNMVKRAGTWYVRKKVGDKTVRITTGCTDYKQALRRAIEILKDINDDRLGWTKKVIPTYDEYAQRYMDLSAHRKAECSAKADVVALKRSMELWQGKRLDSITQDDCTEYMNWREGKAPRPGEPERRKEDGKGGTTNTMLHDVAVIRAVFNAAVNNGLLVRSPWHGVKKPAQIARTRTVSRDDQAGIDSESSEEYRRLLLCYFGTGLRRSEMHALEPHDIDFEHGFIDLPKEKAKGKKKGRTIPLFPEVAAAFKKQIEERTTGREMRRQPGGMPRKNTLAIFNMSAAAALVTFRANARKAGVEDTFTLHDFRRTFCSRCAEAEMGIKQLSEIMGHSDIKITATFYAHVNKENLKRSLLKLDLGLTPVLPSEKVLNFEKKK